MKTTTKKKKKKKKKGEGEGEGEGEEGDEEEEEEEEEDGKRGQNVKIIFQILCTSYITTQPIFVYWLFFTHSSP